MTIYRASLYRLIFAAAAIYNVAFGVWAGLSPNAFFSLLDMAPPNYPGIWQCLGMVVGLYGLLYAYAGWKLDRALPIIAVGLAGKILGPIGLASLIRSGEWPARTLTLITFNDLIWWLPFALFLLEGTRVGRRIRGAAPWVCAGVNALAAAALFALRGGTEAVDRLADRIQYISSHLVWWRLGWSVWMIAAISLVAFYAWWGARLSSKGWSIAAFGVGAVGLACDLFAESLWIGWAPERIGALGSLPALSSGAAANGLYSVAGILLTLRTPFLRGPLRIWAWAAWMSGLALSLFTLLHNVGGMVVSTTALMTLFCPWVAVFGWIARRRDSERASPGAKSVSA